MSKTVVFSQTGYSVDDTRKANVDRLIKLCTHAVFSPDWVSHDITGDDIPETFCNRAVRYIADGCGYKGFAPTDSANMQIAKMAKDTSSCEEIPWADASRYALKGALVVIGVSVDGGHGHVTVVHPSEMQDSSTYQCKVPIVAHVGKPPNGVMRMSGAYSAALRPKLRAFLFKSTVA